MPVSRMANWARGSTAASWRSCCAGCRPSAPGLRPECIVHLIGIALAAMEALAGMGRASFRPWEHGRLDRMPGRRRAGTARLGCRRTVSALRGHPGFAVTNAAASNMVRPAMRRIARIGCRRTVFDLLVAGPGPAAANTKGQQDEQWGRQRPEAE